MKGKGLCYFCDENFSLNHKCPNRQFLMLQWEKENNNYAKLNQQMEQSMVDAIN